jgi:hypothetical protein
MFRSSRLLGYLAVAAGGASLFRAVVGLLAQSRVKQTIETSAKVADRHIQLVNALSWWLNIAWGVFALLSLVAAMLLLGARTGHFLMLWVDVVFGVPLGMATFGLPAPADLVVVSVLALAAVAATLITNVVIWRRVVD